MLSVVAGPCVTASWCLVSALLYLGVSCSAATYALWGFGLSQLPTG